MEMKELFRHDLEYFQSLEYFKDKLEDVNVLSKEILKLINFEEGSFFTLLPNDADISGIYKFKEGGHTTSISGNKTIQRRKVCGYISVDTYD